MGPQRAVCTPTGPWPALPTRVQRSADLGGHFQRRPWPLGTDVTFKRCSLFQEFFFIAFYKIIGLNWFGGFL